MQLLIIDPQIDFCEPSGALLVPGAAADMARLAAYIDAYQGRFEAVHVTLDTHHLRDIAHPLWWKGARGDGPAPFTIISAADLDAGVWRAADPAAQERSRSYVKALETGGRYPLCIWPPHCLIGSAGHAVQQALFRSLCGWETASGKSVHYWRKGENPFTEHYSALRAEVIDPADPATDANLALIDALRGAGEIVVAGEAGSHCVASTLRDLDALAPDLTPRLRLLTDAVSPVAGFENLQQSFIADLTAKGMRLETTEILL